MLLHIHHLYSLLIFTIDLPWLRIRSVDSVHEYWRIFTSYTNLGFASVCILVNIRQYALRLQVLLYTYTLHFLEYKSTPNRYQHRILNANHPPSVGPSCCCWIAEYCVGNGTGQIGTMKRWRQVDKRWNDDHHSVTDGIVASITDGILSSVTDGILAGIHTGWRNWWHTCWCNRWHTGCVTVGILSGVTNGILAGVSDGVLAGVTDRILARVTDGTLAGVTEGKWAVVTDGILADEIDGILPGVADGILAGVTDGILAGVTDGILAGITDGILACVAVGVLPA